MDFSREGTIFSFGQKGLSRIRAFRSENLSSHDLKQGQINSAVRIMRERLMERLLQFEVMVLQIIP